MSERWYVVHTHPNAEARAFDNLARQGFHPYLPRFLSERRHARKVEEVLRPLFPRYLFVRLDLEFARWRAILSTLGVTGLVCRGELPASVPDGVVEDIQARESGGVVPIPRPPSPKAGQKILVTSGPFDGNWGLFEGMTDQHRVVVLLDLLGRNVRVHVPASAVSAGA